MNNETGKPEKAIGVVIEINKNLDNFIYTASHDVKPPSTNIEGLLALLYDEMKEGILQAEDAQHIISLMQAAVERFKKTSQA